MRARWSADHHTDHRAARRYVQALDDRPVTVPDFLATVCRALGIDPATHNMSNTGRPIPLVDLGARPVAELLA